jgi:uncharacterized OB-fold protein
MTATTSVRTLPKATPESAHFWEGAKRGELLLQRCRECESPYFPPQPFCPGCLSDQVVVFRASGRGLLYSYVISHLAVPGFDPPVVLAVVELEEGPRLLTNIVGVEPDPALLPIDLQVEVVFEVFDDVALPLFRPRGN